MSSENDVQPFKVEEDFIDNECLDSELSGSCLYTNENGKGCNDDCNSKKCFVCEITMDETSGNLIVSGLTTTTNNLLIM